MKETEGNEKASFICSICHKTNFKIKQIHIKLKKLFNENMKDNELMELIRICNCSNKNNDKSKFFGREIYTHKYCIILNILFHFELKCQKCNTLYNIKIDKKKAKNKIIFFFVGFLIIYIIHTIIYIFCICLLFINSFLKIKIILLFRHLVIFVAIILLILNTIILFLTIKQNIKKFKYQIYKYSINIFDINYICNNSISIQKENEFYNLLIEFYQIFYNQPMIYLITNINKQYLINKINYLYSNTINNYITKNNNLNVIIINKCENIFKDLNNQQKLNKNLIVNEKEIFLNNDLNLLKLNSPSFQNDSKIYFNQSNISKNIFNFNKSFKDEKMKLSHKDFINININSVASKNININIHLLKEKSSLKEDSSIKLKKIGKTALIPKMSSINNIITEDYSFKRRTILLKSNKIKENKLGFKNDLSGNIIEDDEIDFSEFDKIGSKISKENKEIHKYLSSKNYLDLNYNNFKGKNSYKDVDLYVSSSVVEGSNSNKNKNLLNSPKY